MDEEIQYEWTLGALASPEFVTECSSLYSEHYGTWSEGSSRNPGRPIRLSPDQLRQWTNAPDSGIWFARANRELVGYAIAIQTRVTGYGNVSWVTQFVVHREFRNKRIGTTLLFSIWGMTNHFAWGLTTANPYAIRALEKATRRRCNPTGSQEILGSWRASVPATFTTSVTIRKSR